MSLEISSQFYNQRTITTLFPYILHLIYGISPRPKSLCSENCSIRQVKNLAKPPKIDVCSVLPTLTHSHTHPVKVIQAGWAQIPVAHPCQFCHFTLRGSSCSAVGKAGQDAWSGLRAVQDPHAVAFFMQFFEQGSSWVRFFLEPGQDRIACALTALEWSGDTGASGSCLWGSADSGTTGHPPRCLMVTIYCFGCCSESCRQAEWSVLFSVPLLKIGITSYLCPLGPPWVVRETVVGQKPN